jgi:hypothetical protein
LSGAQPGLQRRCSDAGKFIHARVSSGAKSFCQAQKKSHRCR